MQPENDQVRRAVFLVRERLGRRDETAAPDAPQAIRTALLAEEQESDPSKQPVRGQAAAQLAKDGSKMQVSRSVKRVSTPPAEGMPEDTEEKVSEGALLLISIGIIVITLVAALVWTRLT